MVTEAGDDFITSSHKTLYDLIEGAELCRHEEKVRRRNTKVTFRYRWIEAVSAARRQGRDPGQLDQLRTPCSKSSSRTREAAVKRTSFFAHSRI
jgi:hypothetical protein